MRNPLLLPGLVLVLSLPWVGLAEEAKLDRAKAIEELKAIEEKNEKLTQNLLGKSARDFTEAGADKTKAVQMYLESYRNAEFGRTQEGDTRFQQWKVDNKDKIVSLDFTTAAQLHVQYLGLVCRQALGERGAQGGRMGCLLGKSLSIQGCAGKSG